MGGPGIGVVTALEPGVVENLVLVALREEGFVPTASRGHTAIAWGCHTGTPSNPETLSLNRSSSIG